MQVAEGAEVGVIAGLTILGVIEHCKQGMVEVIAPLRVHAVAVGFARSHNVRIVQVAFGDQVELFRKSRTQALDFD